MINLYICFYLLFFAYTHNQVPEIVHVDDPNLHKYYNYVNKGCYLFIVDKDYIRAKKHFQLAFKIRKAINFFEIGEFEKFVRIDFLNNNVNKKTFKNVKILISKYGYDLSFFRVNSIYYNFNHKDFWNKIEFEYQELREIYMSSINLELRNKIDSMCMMDQKYRGDQNYYILHQKEQNTIDSLNMLELTKIFEEFGYPSEKLIGGFNIDNKHVSIELILLHSPDSLRLNYLIPKLQAYVTQGHCPPQTLAVVVDQYNLYHGVNQIYGVYTDDKQNPIKIADVSTADSMRNLIGLPSLREKKIIDSLIINQISARLKE